MSDPDVTGGPLSWPDAALRYLYLLTLIVWLGGMVTLGALAAPAVFEILEAYDPEMGRVLAGDVFGEILRRFHFVAYGSGVILLGCLGAMATRRPRPRALGVPAGIVGAMLRVRRIAAYLLGLLAVQVRNEARTVLGAGRRAEWKSTGRAT